MSDVLTLYQAAGRSLDYDPETRGFVSPSEYDAVTHVYDQNMRDISQVQKVVLLRP